MLRGVVLALFLATFANASRVPTLKFNLNHDKIGTSPSPEVRRELVAQYFNMTTQALG